MKRTLMNYLSAGLVLCAVGLIVNACGGSTSLASSTLTQAEFDSLLQTSSLYTALNAQVTALQSQVNGMHVRVFSGATSAADTRMTEAITTTTQNATPQSTVSGSGIALGTFEGYVALSNGSIVPSTQQSAIGIAILSNQGYTTYATLNGDELYQTNLYFTSADCTGTPYLLQVGGGLAFRSGDMSAASLADPTTYWAIAPGTPSASVQFNSAQYAPGNCVALGAPQTLTAYAATQNVQATSGFQNANFGTLSIN